MSRSDRQILRIRSGPSKRSFFFFQLRRIGWPVLYGILFFYRTTDKQSRKHIYCTVLRSLGPAAAFVPTAGERRQQSGGKPTTRSAGRDIVVVSRAQITTAKKFAVPCVKLKRLQAIDGQTSQSFYYILVYVNILPLTLASYRKNIYKNRIIARYSTFFLGPYTEDGRNKLNRCRLYRIIFWNYQMLRKTRLKNFIFRDNDDHSVEGAPLRNQFSTTTTLKRNTP